MIMIMITMISVAGVSSCSSCLVEPRIPDCRGGQIFSRRGQRGQVMSHTIQGWQGQWQTHTTQRQIQIQQGQVINMLLINIILTNILLSRTTRAGRWCHTLSRDDNNKYTHKDKYTRAINILFCFQVFLPHQSCWAVWWWRVEGGVNITCHQQICKHSLSSPYL